MAAINWIQRKDSNNNKEWIATDNGKRWIEKIVQHELPEDREPIMFV